MTHIGTAAVSVALINWLKKSPWFPWITQEKSKVMRIVAIVTAGIGTVGITYTWNPATRDVLFHIPTLAALVHGVGTYVQSFAMQELSYQATKRPNLAELAKAVIAAVQSPVKP